MKKIETFEGIVNGKKFTSREAMNNYLKDLNEDITEYVVNTTTRFVDDDNDKGTCGTCTCSENQGGYQSIEDNLTLVDPYKNIIEYLIPTPEEIAVTEDIVKDNKSALNKVDRNLERRMEYYVNNIEGACCQDPIFKKLADAAKESAESCSTRKAYLEDEFDNLEKEIEDIEKSLNEKYKIQNNLCRVLDYYNNLKGYLDAMIDIF